MAEDVPKLTCSAADLLERLYKDGGWLYPDQTVYTSFEVWVNCGFVDRRHSKRMGDFEYRMTEKGRKYWEESGGRRRKR